ncbi:MAG: hypothetical protein JST30_12355 [Armatimonadetes bacterium]|nr:hypothetical protein [Armatimonadota bacterium]
MRTAVLAIGMATIVCAGCAPQAAPAAKPGLVGSWVGQPGPGQVTFEFEEGGGVTITSIGQGGGKTVTTTEVKGKWKVLGKDASQPSSVEITYEGGRFVSGNEMAKKPFEDNMAKKAGTTLVLLVEWTSADVIRLSPQRGKDASGPTQDPLTLTRLGSAGKI